jgi:hypothetical protein
MSTWDAVEEKKNPMQKEFLNSKLQRFFNVFSRKQQRA